MAKARFNITLDPEYISVLRILEKATGASASEHIRRAIVKYVNGEVLAMEPAIRAEVERRKRLIQTTVDTKSQSKTARTAKAERPRAATRKRS